MIFFQIKYKTYLYKPVVFFFHFIFFHRRQNTNTVPKLTLYTKDPCPLCDELKLQLEPFLKRCTLETVDITRKENLRWLRLYRYEIPVLFFNGEYLCKHKLDDILLEKKLKSFEEENG